MRVEYRFSCTLKNGLHARPASMLAEAARAFTSAVVLRKGTGESADLRSVLSLVGLDIKLDDECVIEIEGDDAAACRVALVELIEQRLRQEDEAGSEAIAHAETDTVSLPVSLARLHPRVLRGRGVSGGIGRGDAVIVSGLTLTPEQASARAGSAEEELARLRLATAGLRDELSRRALTAAGLERELLSAHASMAADPAMLAEMEAQVRRGATAVQAVSAAAGGFCQRLSGATSAYIRDRVVDVQDVAMQLLTRLGGKQCMGCEVTLRGPSVVFADVLTPSQLMAFERSKLQGLVLGPVGATSHTIILARSMGVPTIIDAPVHEAREGWAVIVDGTRGVALVEPTPPVARWYDAAQHAEHARARRLLPLVGGRAVTRDGVALEVGCNASGLAEVERAAAGGADGVGLLRTELLFLERDTPPSEDEQFEQYAAVVRAAGGRPVIIRTLDIGGDKPAPYMKLPAEDNPFLGERGFRLYSSHQGLIQSQLRAVLRVSVLGPVKVMAPMISTPAEAAVFRVMVEEAKRSLEARGQAFGASVAVGVMVEVPALATVMDQLCRHVDFVSIGTNDLAQYTFAVDRGNRRVAALHDVRHPAFLRLLRTIVEGARAAGTWVGVCGEMGGDPANIPVLLGLGVDEVSAAPGEIGKIKLVVREADAGRCRELLARACNCEDSAQVASLLGAGEWRGPGAAAVVSEELIAVGVRASTKEEAIRAAVDHLYVHARTDGSDVVEAAVWAREGEYSTGLGYGFAVPHCRTESVTAASLVVLKLASPVEWESSDGQPVSVVMLLTVPAADTTGAHMKVFAKLARKLMHEEFRDSITAARTPGELHAALSAALGL
ncbi:MAG TPA: phosphoenolpyruvate--protein phosphotransferase [Phycisphaerales bacterium]|nr:phosphoenolpyruvate--protein phosphotransferase [Phycisphaerales bacterium]